MDTKPHDVTDLYLAPIALELDRRLERLSGRTPHEIGVEVVVSTDREPRDAEERADLLLASLTHLLPMHGWDAGWTPRGVRLEHRGHALVLGVPPSVSLYLTA
ncbi:MAG: hypothetical protein JWN84_4501 [Nocardioides sp.]|jgi:hypothetical protein|nr:hypothetical protein [Nocardioides sp.]